jgi:hypothetical protein
VKIAFHVADAMISPGKAFSAPFTGVKIPVLGLKGMAASLAHYFFKRDAAGWLVGCGCIIHNDIAAR